MKVSIVAAAAIAAGTGLAEAAVASAASATCGRESITMAESIMSRAQGIMTGLGGSSEALQAGVVQKALSAVVDQYPNGTSSAAIAKYIERSAGSATRFLSNASNDALAYPMDRLSNGNALIRLYAHTGNETYRQAFEALRDSIDLNRRNDFGGLWYFVYPNWSYLDGMFSLAPFATLYDATQEVPVSNTTALADLEYQLQLVWDRCRNASFDNLLVHGYDATATAVWATGSSGQSPHVWGRSLGWFMMALADTIDTVNTWGFYAHSSLEAYASLHARATEMLSELAASVVRAADPITGAWWQVMDRPGAEGNYIESSGSAMFAYALVKGARLGVFGDKADEFGRVGRRAWSYLNETFVVRHGNGTVDYNGTVAVCSLNSTASYEYYINQPILYNSVLGSGAFILASLEVERLGHC